ncbi:MAG: GntR family transcriptional regulator [Rhodospirillales bacterium]|nr:GntR family transcriptional regulator [Rhodospirillales bacterium]
MQVNEITKASAFGVVEQQSLVEQVRDKILGAIVKGELQPDERLSEADLARRMGVSRGPIREAARLLEQRGFLRSEPRRGFFVRALTLDDIEHLHEIRSCLAVHAAKKAKELATPDDIRTLRDLYTAVCAVATGRGDPLAPLEANYAFHRFIFSLTKNPRFIEFYEDMIWEGRQIATIVNLAESTAGAYFVETLLPLVIAFEEEGCDQVGEAMKVFLQVNHEGILEFYHQYMASDSESRQ